MEQRFKFFLDFFPKRLGYIPQKELPLPRFLKKHDLVAQPVEHLTFNQGVMGSNPIEITTTTN
jgi:hypothetical protein